MSYDLKIVPSGNTMFSVGSEEVSTFLLQMPNIVMNGPNHFLFQDEANTQYFELDLELVAANGDSIAVGEQQDINCIRIHIPYAYLERTLEATVETCKQIAAHLRWTAFDEQTEEVLV